MRVDQKMDDTVDLAINEIKKSSCHTLNISSKLNKFSVKFSSIDPFHFIVILLLNDIVVVIYNSFALLEFVSNPPAIVYNFTCAIVENYYVFGCTGR